MVSGGTAVSAAVLSGGSETISAGGIDISATIDGSQTVLGTASATTLDGGAVQTVSSGGVAIGTVISSGDSQIVLSGGTASGTIVLSGGSEVVSSGGTASTTTISRGGSETVLGTGVSGTISSGGTLTVSAGGLASAVIVGSGGHEYLLSGGGASGTVIRGGTLTVSSGASASGAMVSAGSELVLSGATVTGVTVSGGSEVVSAGGTASATTILTGGSETVLGTEVGGTVSGGGQLVLSGGTLSGGVTDAGTVIGAGTVSGTIGGTGTIEASGGTLDLVSNIGTGTGLTFDIGSAASSVLKIDGTVGTGNTFTFLNSISGELNDTNATALQTTISGLNIGTSNTDPTNYIDLSGQGSLSLSGANTFTGTSATLTFANGTTLDLTGVTGASGTWYVDYKPDGGTGTEIFASDVVCFAAGTRILTATGERMIDSLMAGDIVLTLSGDELSAQPVKWIGRRRIDLTAHPRPETVAPVRIQRGAFADAMPHTDLLLSPDHAVFANGKLICVRQLVNGTTIRQEQDWTSVEYFHVELDTHAILLAEGLPAESYLDTGNRGFFANSNEPLVLHPDLTDETDYPTREAGSCAPFVWDEASVRPVWQHLADRAAALGQPAPKRDTTTDPALRLVAKGRTVRPLYAENGLHIFALPKGTTEVHLVSRASAPTDTRPWLEDRRQLGVYVERIALRTAIDVRDVPVDHPGLSRGWWAVERNGRAMRRWTNGEAVLSLPAVSWPTMLEIRASSGGVTYVVSGEPEAEAGRRVA